MINTHKHLKGVWYLLLAATFFSFLSLQGCRAAGGNPTLETLRNLKIGISKEQLETMLGTKGTHQFTVQEGSNCYLCLSFSFEKPYISYYFLLRNGCLQSMMPRPPPEMERIPYKNTFREVQRPLDVEKRVRLIIHEKGLSGMELVESVRKALPEGTSSLNVLPAFIVTAPLWLMAAKDIKNDYDRNKELAERFDPLKLDVGLSNAQVQMALGNPIKVIGSGDRTVCLYGSDEPLRVSPVCRFSWVAVTFEGGKVTRIFSNDLFDRRLLR